ncbi:MAG: NAD(P)-dependent oxidoreductase [Muribaculaceae bacterium]|nr:NAD(P)-dependent oxidoreductase [Muribaculaceae bacterium]
MLRADIERFAERFPFIEEVKGKRFLITGATGLIGSYIVRGLLELNKRRDADVGITALVRNGDKARQMFGDEGVEIVTGDIENWMPEGERAADYVFHCASPTASKELAEKPVEVMQAIVGGTSNLLRYCREKRVKGMVYLSSLEVYGVSESDEPKSETYCGRIDTSSPRSSYPVAKMAAEALCSGYASEYGLNVMTARLCQVFGAGVPAGDRRVFSQFASAVRERRDIVLHTEGRSAKQYCDTADAVGALFYILLKGKKGKIYNVANPANFISIREMAEMVVREFNPELKVKIEKREDAGYAADTILRLDTGRIEALGWKPEVSLKEMFSKLIYS